MTHNDTVTRSRSTGWVLVSGVRMIALAATALFVNCFQPLVAKACWFCSGTPVGVGCFPAGAGYQSCDDIIDYDDDCQCYLCVSPPPPVDCPSD